MVFIIPLIIFFKGENMINKIEQMLKKEHIKYTKEYLDGYFYGFYIELNPRNERHENIKHILGKEFKHCIIEAIDWNEENILCEYITYSYVL